MHGCETWTISEAMKKPLVVTEMRFPRRILKISCIKKVMNENELRRAQTERELMKQIVKRRCHFLGHENRKGSIECQVNQFIDVFKVGKKWYIVYRNTN